MCCREHDDAHGAPSDSIHRVSANSHCGASDALFTADRVEQERLPALLEYERVAELAHSDVNAPGFRTGDQQLCTFVAYLGL